jgi:hypothetical protein
LGIVITKKPYAIEPVNVEVRKPILMLRTLPTERPKPGEMFVNGDALAEVIRLIDLVGKNFEVAPGTYNKLVEEDLRNIIVATLNAVFESNIATGETFSRLGKSDIRLAVPRGDILIAECKIWHGQGEYTKSINQLFRYLTHRHSVGMLITFLRDKQLETMLERAGKAIKGHKCYKAGYQIKGPTYYISTHKHPTSADGEIVIHHLFFHLYASVPSD